MSNANDFFERYKKAIDLIEVSIDSVRLEIPIIYSAEAAEFYRKEYSACKNFRRAFLAMAYHILSSNWSIIFEDNSKPLFSLEAFSSISLKDITKIYESIVKSSKYLRALEEEVSSEITDIFEKFYIINTKEYEKYVNKLQKIQTSLLPIEKQFRSYQKAIGPMVNSLAAVNAFYISPEIQKIMSNISKIRDMYSSPIIKQMSEYAKISSQISKNIAYFTDSYSQSINAFTQFLIDGKLVKLQQLQAKIVQSIRPAIFDIVAIGIGRRNLEKYLEERIETFYKFGWAYISVMDDEILDYIYVNKDRLSQEEVDKIICEYFEKNNFEIIDNLIKELNETEFYGNIKKLKESVLAYKNGLYSLCVHTLAILPEGLIREFMDEEYGVRHRSFKAVNHNFKNKVDEVMNFTARFLLMCIDKFYISFEPQEKNKTPDFSRHKICHGLAQDIDRKEYCLKLILYNLEIISIIKGIIESRKVS